MKPQRLIAPTLASLFLTACVSSGMNPHDRYPVPNNPQPNYPAYPQNDPVYPPTQDQPQPQPQQNPRQPMRPQQQGYTGGPGHFDCENGLAVDIRHLGTEQIELRLNDKSAVLKNATTASGERYTASKGLYGRGADWHQKGTEAILNFTDPYGNVVETNCRSGIIRN